MKWYLARDRQEHHPAHARREHRSPRLRPLSLGYRGEKGYLHLSHQLRLPPQRRANDAPPARPESWESGYRTKQGEFVITDKHRRYNSSIYGYVPNYAASHGCIRLPIDSAKKLFVMTKVGDTVMIKP